MTVAATLGDSRAGGAADGGDAGGAAGNTSVAGDGGEGDEGEGGDVTADTVAAAETTGGASTALTAGVTGRLNRSSHPSPHIAAASNATPAISAMATSHRRLVGDELSAGPDNVTGCA